MTNKTNYRAPQQPQQLHTPGWPGTPESGPSRWSEASDRSPTEYTPDSGRPEQFIVSTILPGFLYLGPDPTTEQEVDQLTALGVRRILNMARECEDGLGLARRFETYKKVGITDSVEETAVADGLREACAFLEEARRDGAPTYVHCRAGKSRSVTVVLAYLMESHRWSLKKAYAYVLDHRKGISPNIGFMAELLNVEADLARKPGSVGRRGQVAVDGRSEGTEEKEGNLEGVGSDKEEGPSSGHRPADVVGEDQQGNGP